MDSEWWQILLWHVVVVGSGLALMIAVAWAVQRLEVRP